MLQLLAYLLRAVLDAVAGFLGYVASRIGRVFEGLADVGFASFGNYFLRAVVTHLYFGSRGSLGDCGGGERAGGEQQNDFFHD